MMETGAAVGASASTGATLRELEGVAARLMAAIAPLRIGVAERADDLEAVFRLRGAEVAERGWASPGAAPSLRDCDAHDGDAVQIAIWDGAEVVGTCRLLLPAPPQPLPIERDFDLRLEPHGRVVQWGRLVLAPGHRGDPQHRPAIACFAALWLETTRHGFASCAGAVSRPMLALYAGMGLDFEVLGPARLVDGEARFPAVSSAETLRSALALMRRLLA